MKRWIHAATTHQKLLLAKGIIFQPNWRAQNEELMQQFVDKNDYIEKINIDGSNLSYYIAYTESEYDLYTGQLSGRLINHQSLLHKLSIPDNIKFDSISYFRVDLNPTRTGNELIVSKAVNPELVKYLRNKFHVSEIQSASVDNLEWLPIDSVEFKSQFKEAGQDARRIKRAIEKMQNTSNNDESARFAFAMCFAVIDSSRNLGAASSNPFIFEADTYKECHQKKRRFAKQCGMQPDDLIFKILFSSSRDMDYKDGQESDLNTEDGLEKHTITLLRQLKSKFKVNYDDASIYDEYMNVPMSIDFRVQSDTIEPEVELTSDNSAILYLPNHNNYNTSELVSIVDEAFDAIKNQIDN